MSTVVKSSKSDREIEGILYEAEKTVKKIKVPQDDYAMMMDDANRNREHGLYNLDKMVGKITIGPLCSQETLKSLTNSNTTPHTVIQTEVW